MNKKICFFDVDGTLTSELSHNMCVIPESAKRAIKKAKDNGVLVFINTGRPFGTLPKELLELDVNGYCCGCGTFIMMDDEVLFHRVIENEERSLLLKSINDFGIGAILEGKSGYSVMNAELVSQNEGDDIYRIAGFPYHDYRDFDFEKLCIYIDEANNWPSLDFLAGFDIIHKNDTFKEIVPLSCSKWKAIKFLLAKLNISEEDCYVFGDGDNDLSVFMEATNKIAMGNATDNIKKLATFVTKNASDDGIEYALKYLNLI